MSAKSEKHHAAKGMKQHGVERDEARLRRIAVERGANDPTYIPKDTDAQIDASGARFRNDG